MATEVGGRKLVNSTSIVRPLGRSGFHRLRASHAVKGASVAFSLSGVAPSAGKAVQAENLSVREDSEGTGNGQEPSSLTPIHSPLLTCPNLITTQPPRLCMTETISSKR